jgi:hypothetical protein
MAFPDSDLPLRWEAAFGADPEASPGTWTFTDLTSRNLDSVVNLRVGRRAGSKTADPSSVGALFNNHDGDLTPLRAMSTYWPNIKLDTPFRCKLRRADDTFTRTVSNGWGTSDSLHVWTTSGGAAADYSTSGTQGSVAAGAVDSDRLTLVDLDGRHQDVRITATTNATPTGGAIETGVVARYSDASNYYVAGASVSTGGIVTAVIFKRVAGVRSAVTSVSTGLSTATSKRIRFRITENRLQLKVWLTSASEPDAWTLDVFDNSLSTGDLAGSYSRRSTGNSTPTTFTYDNFDTTHVLLEGFTDSWKPDFMPNTDGGTSVVRVTASGPLRRLGQGAKPLRSTPMRYLSGLTGTVPVAAWTLEDGQLAAAGAPLYGSSSLRAFVGTHPSGAVITYPQWGQGSLAPWLPQVVSRSSSGALTVLWAPVSMPGFTNTWTVDFAYSSGSDAPISVVDINPSYLGGSLGWPQLTVVPVGGDVSVSFDGSPETTTSMRGLFDGRAHHIRWTALQSGANVTWTVSVDAILVQSGTELTSTLPAITTIAFASEATSAAIALGYATVWTTAAAVGGFTNAIMGNAGESAIDRLTRLCLEEGVPFSVMQGFASAAMGPELPDTFMANVLDCETTDQGVLGEDNFGLTYIPRPARYRRPVGATIDLSTYRTTAGTSDQVLAPIFDDQVFRNEWTVSRPDGPTFVAADFTRVKLRYGDTATPNLLTDAEVVSDMLWRLAVSSIEAIRWPNTPVDLAANPEMIGEWLGVTPGLTRIVRTGLPSRGPDGDIDELLDGVEHTIRRRAWTINYAASPAKVYNGIGVFGTDPVGSGYDSADSTLAAGYSSSATSFSVATTAGHALWITGSGAPNFPFDIEVSGIRITVTAISGASSPQTFTVTRSVDGYDKALGSGVQVSRWDPARYGR